MKTIFKTWKKNTYFEGIFELRNKNMNWAIPIDFPAVFTAYGKAIKTGNWRSVTSINYPEYAINNYFDTIGHEKNDAMYQMWEYCKQLDKITWEDVKNNEDDVLKLIALANQELYKLKKL